MVLSSRTISVFRRTAFFVIVAVSLLSVSEGISLSIIPTADAQGEEENGGGEEENGGGSGEAFEEENGGDVDGEGESADEGLTTGAEEDVPVEGGDIGAEQNPSPCPAGQGREPDTGECAPLPPTPCPPGLEPEPDTGECLPLPLTVISPTYLPPNAKLPVPLPLCPPEGCR